MAPARRTSNGRPESANQTPGFRRCHGKTDISGSGGGLPCWGKSKPRHAQDRSGASGAENPGRKTVNTSPPVHGNLAGGLRNPAGIGRTPIATQSQAGAATPSRTSARAATEIRGHGGPLSRGRSVGQKCKRNHEAASAGSGAMFGDWTLTTSRLPEIRPAAIVVRRLLGQPGPNGQRASAGSRAGCTPTRSRSSAARRPKPKRAATTRARRAAAYRHRSAQTG